MVMACFAPLVRPVVVDQDAIEEPSPDAVLG